MNVEISRLNSANRYNSYYNETGGYCGSKAGSRSVIGIIKAFLNQIDGRILPKCPIQVNKK